MPKRLRLRRSSPADPTNYATDEPVKHRVEVAEDGGAAVIDSKPGEVSFGDKAKSYYHTIITIIGALLVLLNEATPLTASWGEGSHWLSVAIVFLTAVVNALKSNEKWVNAL